MATSKNTGIKGAIQKGVDAIKKNNKLKEYEKSFDFKKSLNYDAWLDKKPEILCDAIKNGIMSVDELISVFSKSVENNSAKLKGDNVLSENLAYNSLHTMKWLLTRAKAKYGEDRCWNEDLQEYDASSVLARMGDTEEDKAFDKAIAWGLLAYGKIPYENHRSWRDYQLRLPQLLTPRVIEYIHSYVEQISDPDLKDRVLRSFGAALLEIDSMCFVDVAAFVYLIMHGFKLEEIFDEEMNSWPLLKISNAYALYRTNKVTIEKIDDEIFLPLPSVEIFTKAAEFRVNSAFNPVFTDEFSEEQIARMKTARDNKIQEAVDKINEKHNRAVKNLRLEEENKRRQEAQERDRLEKEEQAKKKKDEEQAKASKAEAELLRQARADAIVEDIDNYAV